MLFFLRTDLLCSKTKQQCSEAAEGGGFSFPLLWVLFKRKEKSRGNGLRKIMFGSSDAALKVMLR